MRSRRGNTPQKLRGWTLAAALLGACPGLLAVPSTALASASDEAMAAGLKKFDEGRKAFEAGQFEEALNAFRASLELFPSPNTRLYVARCYRAIGKTASAYTAFKLAAHEAQDRQAATGEKRYAATRDTANQEAAALEAKVPRITVAVPSNPPEGFVVKMDGSVLQKAAWGIATEADPGTIVVEATGPRLVPFKKTITLKEGVAERVDIPLTRLPTATVAVKLLTLPAGLYLTLDGQPLDLTGVDAPRDVDVGEHSLVAHAPGYLPFTWHKTLANADAQVIEVSLLPNPDGGHGPGGTPKWLFFTVAAAAVASLGAGAAVAAHAESQQSQQEGLDLFARDPAVQKSIQTQATITDVLFIGGGVLGAGAVALAFTTRWKTHEAPAKAQAISVAPWFTATGGGVGAHGAF
jgi:hypothetical protein